MLRANYTDYSQSETLLVDVSDCKSYLGIGEDTSDDEIIEELLKSATDMVSHHIHQAVGIADHREFFRGFSRVLCLSRNIGTQSVAVSYLSKTDAYVTLPRDDYYVDRTGDLTELVFSTMPDRSLLSERAANPVRATYTWGTSVGPVNRHEGIIKNAIRNLTRILYDRRGGDTDAAEIIARELSGLRAIWTLAR